MINIVILGSGNVASHLCKAFAFSDNTTVIQVYSRNEESFINLPGSIETTTDLSEIKNASLYIIAITDDSIKNFSEKLPFTDRLVTHTSGSVSMNELSKRNRRGVFYPLQTFSKSREIDFRDIPICIEAENIRDLELLKEIGSCVSNHVESINSKKRAKLHVAAVFVNNFVNHLYRIGYDLLEEESLTFDLLKPLINETSKKVNTIKPEDAQTGPAIRNDMNTIGKHLHLLKNRSDKEIYRIISNIISKSHEKEL